MGNRLFRSDWRELCEVAVPRRGSPGTDYNGVSYHMFCRGPHMGNRLFRSDWRELCAIAVARRGSPGTDYNGVSYHMFCRGPHMGNRLFRSDWRELCAIAVAKRGSPGTDIMKLATTCCAGGRTWETDYLGVTGASSVR